MCLVKLSERDQPVLYEADEYLTSSRSTKERNFSPFSSSQALYFFTKVRMLTKGSQKVIMKEFSHFLSRDKAFSVVLAFAGTLKPSSRRTYQSVIRMFIQVLDELYPRKFDDLTPFTLLALIRDGVVTREHVRQFFCPSNVWTSN